MQRARYPKGFVAGVTGPGAPEPLVLSSARPIPQNWQYDVGKKHASNRENSQEVAAIEPGGVRRGVASPRNPMGNLAEQPNDSVRGRTVRGAQASGWTVQHAEVGGSFPASLCGSEQAPRMSARPSQRISLSTADSIYLPSKSPNGVPASTQFEQVFSFHTGATSPSLQYGLWLHRPCGAGLICRAFACFAPRN